MARRTVPMLPIPRSAVRANRAARRKHFYGAERHRSGAYHAALARVDHQPNLEEQPRCKANISIALLQYRRLRILSIVYPDIHRRGKAATAYLRCRRKLLLTIYLHNSMTCRHNKSRERLARPPLARPNPTMATTHEQSRISSLTSAI